MINNILAKILLIVSILFFWKENLFSQNASTCNSAQYVCTNPILTFTANSGTGLTPGLGVSNPFTNPQFVNAGCMFLNVPNPQWLIINITSSGNLGFCFGALASAFPQAGNYDWIMWPYNPTACSDIFNNALPPVACNWNCTGAGGTGMGTVPVGGSFCNFQPSIPVVQGQQYIILITNPSGVNTNVSFQNTGTAGVSCNPIIFPNLTACPGQLAVFTGTWVNTTAGSFTLNPGNVVQTNPSFTVSSLVNQVYTVTATGTDLSLAAINDQTTFTLTINPVIPISVSTPTNFCYGTNATFTISPSAGGTFTVSGPAVPTATYFTSNISIPNIITPNIGTFSVVANYTNGCIGSQTTAVNVAPNNSITVNTTSNVCQGSSVNLTASLPTATAYAWSGPNGFVSTLQNPIINGILPASAGVYTVNSDIVFNGITCARTNTTQINVVATSPVAVTPNFTLCEGSNLNLTSNAVGAVSYSWNGPGTYTSALQNPIVASLLPSDAGNYNVMASFTNAALTCTTGAVSNVSVVATSTVAVALPNNICQNATANLSANAVGAISYSWTGPNAFTSNIAAPSITNIQTNGSGIYTATAMFSIGSVSCTTTATDQIDVVGTSTVAVTPNFTLCEGANLNLNSNAVGAVSYSWNGPGAYTSAVQNPIVVSVLPSDAGNYNVVASFSNAALTCTTGAVSNVSVVATSTVAVTVPNNICQNATANLSANAVGAISYSWTGPNAFTSNIAAPSITNIQTNGSGIYTSTAMFSIGSVSCTTSATDQIDVVGTSTVAVTPNFTLCEGTNLNLTSNAVGAVSYSWNGPGAYTSVVQNPIVASVLPSDAGNYNVVASFSNAALTCTTGAVSNVSVVATSTVAVALPNNICQNATANLSANAVGAISYSWTGPNTFTSNIAAPSITNIQTNGSGIYTATAMFSIGSVSCTTSATDQISVVGTSTVAVTPNFTLCEGSTLNLTSNAVGAVSYSWNGPGTYTSALQNPVIASVLPSDAGNYNIVADFSNGALTCTTGAVSNVSVVATSTVALTLPNNICQNATANLSANAVGAISYSWTGPNAFSSAIAAPTIANIQTNGSGIYTATAMFSIGSVSCTTSATNQISVVGTSTVAVTPNFTVCEASNLNLTSNAVGAVSYSWNGPGGYNSAIQNPTVTPVLPSSAGNYTAIASFSNAALTCSTSAVSNVMVVGTPTINVTVPADICQNATANLSANAVGAISYSWTGPNAFSSNIAAPSIPSIQTNGQGVYTTTAMFSIGTVSCTNTSTNQINVVGTNTVSVALTNTICEGASLNLTSNALSAVSYSWNGPAGYTSALQNPIISPISPGAVGNYTATAFFTNGNLTCTTSAVSNVSVVATPAVNVIVPANICQNATANISTSAVGAVSYLWNGPNGFTSNLAATSITNIQTNGAGVYTSTATFAIGSVSCTNTGTNQINVVAINSITINSVTNGCALQDNVLQASSVGAVSYQWNGPGGFTAAVQNPTLTNTPFSAAGIYTVTAFYSNGALTCTNSASTNLIVNPVITFTLPTSQFICYNASLTIPGPAGASSYTWQNSTGVVSNSQNLFMPNVITSQAGTFSLTAQIGFCKTMQTTQVNLSVPINFFQAPTSISLCKGDSVKLAVSSTGGSGNYAYEWSPSIYLSSSTGSVQTITPMGTVLYNLFAYDIACPTYTIVRSFTVNVKQPPIPDLRLDKTTGCEPLCALYDSKLNGNAASVVYDFGGIKQIAGDNFTYCINTPGTYELNVITTGTNGCKGKFKYVDPIIVYPRPHADFTFLPQIPTLANNQVNFTPTELYGKIISRNWMFAGTNKTNLDTTSEQFPERLYEKVGKFPVMLIEVTDKGCADTVFKLVEVIDDMSVYIPNTFTPNGDGKNDVFLVKGIGFSTDDFVMELFATNGNLIFSTRDYSMGWDGTVKGQPAQIGSYTYKIKVLGTHREGYKEYVGHVNLIR